MHKNVFKVAVASSALALAAAASAQVEKAETGNVLLFPYYTTENTNETLINVINTTDQTKALKVRFREAKGSEDSLDFHVYMSPKDRWTAAMTQDSNGTPTLVTGDNTCTFGRVRGNAEASQANVKTTYLDEIESKLEEADLSGRDMSESELADLRGDPEDRIREGYIEIIEMAVLPDEGVTDLGWYAEHVDGTPRNCAVFAELNTQFPQLRPGAYTENGGMLEIDEETSVEVDSSQFFAPTGGLFANAALINVNDATYLPYDVTAINDTALVLDTLFFSQNSSGGAGELLAFTADRGLKFVKDNDLQYWDLPDLSTTGAPGVSSAAAKVQQLSDALLATSVHNEYFIDPAIGASTDWVVTLPTKRYHTNGTFPTSGSEAGISFGGEVGDPDGVVPPFTTPFDYAKAESEEIITPLIFDSEEGTIEGDTPEGGFSPGIPEAPDLTALKWEANVFTIQQSGTAMPSASPVLGATQTLGRLPVGDFTKGWIELDLTTGQQRAEQTQVGLPVLGFAAWQFINDGFTPEGSLNQYGGTFRHRVENDGPGLTIE